MQHYRKSAAYFLALIIVAALVYQWQKVLLSSVASFRPLASEVTLTSANETPTQLSERVVLIIVSGLGNEAMQHLTLPNLARLQESGANATVLSKGPTYRRPVWISLLSGMEPAYIEAPLLDMLPTVSEPAADDTIFDRAAQHSKGVILAGQQDWQIVVPNKLLDTAIITMFENGQGDQQVMDGLEGRIDDADNQLFVIQFNQLENAAQFGVESEEYQNAAEQIDAYIGQLASAFDLNKTTMLITADYGHIKQGGHGGTDLAVIQQPLLIVGKNVIPGSYSAVAQVDIGPTIAALAGLSFPAANQGRPLLEMLQVSNRHRGRILVSLARQRIIFSQGVLSALNMPLLDETGINDAEGFLNNQNFDGASQLAELLIEQSELAIAEAKHNSTAGIQRIRLGISLAILVASLFFFSRQRSQLWGDALISGLGIVASYHLLYLLARNPYSLSAIADFDNLSVEIMARVLFSLSIGSFIFFTLLVLRQANKIAFVLQGSYEMIFVGLMGFLVPVLYSFWQTGLTITLFFPDVTILFYYITGLTQTFWLAILGLMVPPAIIPVNLAAQRILIYYQQKRTFEM